MNRLPFLLFFIPTLLCAMRESGDDTPKWKMFFCEGTEYLATLSLEKREELFLTSCAVGAAARCGDAQTVLGVLFEHGLRQAL